MRINANWLQFASVGELEWIRRIRLRFQGLSHDEKQFSLHSFSINGAIATSWIVETTRTPVNKRMGQASVKRQLEGVARNRMVHERIAKELRELGCE